MKSKRLAVLLGTIFMGLMLGLMTQMADGATWPRAFVCAVPSSGGSNFFMSAGMGQVIEKYTPLKEWTTQPLGGASTWGPMLKTHEVDFGIISGSGMIPAFLGEGDFAKMGPVLTRAVAGGNVFPLAFHCNPKSKIRRIEDLKGKVVYAKKPGVAFVEGIAKAMLATVGLTPKDCKAWMVIPSYDEAIADLIERRIDAVFDTVSAAEMVTRVNEGTGECVFVDMTKEQAAKVAAQFDGFFVRTLPAMEENNKKPIRNALHFQTFLHCRADLDPDIVYEITKVIMTHYDEYKDVHRVAKQWGPNANPVTVASEPYHEGAVRYYKKAGLWTDQVQKANDALLAKFKKK